MEMDRADNRDHMELAIVDVRIVLTGCGVFETSGMGIIEGFAASIGAGIKCMGC